MARKKILWLCSWYPAKTDPFNGDFVQRMARAAALYNDIHVIHLAADDASNGPGLGEEELQDGHLSEHIIYLKKGASSIEKISSHVKWLKCYKSAIKRYISKEGRPDLVHVQVPMKAGILALWIKRKFRIPFIFTEHWGIYNEIEVNNFKRKHFLFRYYTKKIVRKADGFISVSRYLAEALNQAVSKKKYITLPNVVDTELFFEDKKPHQVFRFIHVSNMVPLKNAPGIVSAFQLLLARGKKAELVMIGSEDPKIPAFASSLSLPDDSISIKGIISYEEVANQMRLADAFILNSDIENSPCVVGEALCTGLPVIATAVGGVPELLSKENSILILPGDDEGLSLAMEKMLETYEEYDLQHIAAAAKNKFSYQSVGKQLDEAYSKISASAL